MGLFAHEDGRYKGWLAAFLCCVAAVNEDEYAVEKNTPRAPQSTTTPATCTQQPVLQAELPFPQSPIELPTFTDNDPIVEPKNPSTILKPFVHPPSTSKSKDERSDPQPERRTLQPHARSFSRHIERPVISGPTSFRRLEYTESQRASLVPLRLGPVILSDTKASDDTDSPFIQQTNTSNNARPRSDSTQRLLSEQDISDTKSRRTSYFADRVSPFERCQAAAEKSQQSQEQDISTKCQDQSQDVAQSPTSYQNSERSSRPPLSAHSSTSSLRRQVLEASGSAVTPRSLSSERHRPKRKRSLQSIRKPYAESGDMELDKEVLELNTIVEERRAETSLSRSPDDMSTEQTRARSETLNDIGSAFFRAPNDATSRDEQGKDKHEDTVRPTTSRGLSNASSRVSGWLSGIMHSSTSPTATQEPFYKCAPESRQRSQSAGSFCSSVSELESPSFTMASSPTSKGHTRSFTADSRVTSLSPPSTVTYDHMDVDCARDTHDRWQVEVVSPSQVGLAL